MHGPKTPKQEPNPVSHEYSDWDVCWGLTVSHVTVPDGRSKVACRVSNMVNRSFKMKKLSAKDQQMRKLRSSEKQLENIRSKSDLRLKLLVCQIHRPSN